MGDQKCIILVSKQEAYGKEREKEGEEEEERERSSQGMDFCMEFSSFM